MRNLPANLFKPFNEIERLIGECFETVRREEENLRHAENSNRRKDEFLAVVAHELRNTLHSTGGWLGLLGSGKLTGSDARRAVEAIKRIFKLQTTLVEDLMDVSQISSGTFRLNLREMEIAPVIKSVVTDFEILAKAKQIEVESQLPTNLGTLTADAERLTQVMYNLLSNAIKFTPVNGRISVRSKRKNSVIEMQVIDNGRGIAADFLPLIFDAFSQSEPSGKEKPNGLGLGLSIVRQIVALHGGSIQAQSAGCDRGATFTVQIPHNIFAETQPKDCSQDKSKTSSICRSAEIATRSVEITAGNS